MQLSDQIHLLATRVQIQDKSAIHVDRAVVRGDGIAAIQVAFT